MSNFNAPIINKVMIVGSLVCDPKINPTLRNKLKVANLRIASGRKIKTSGRLKDDYCYVNVTAWLKLADICENLKQGDKIYVEGSLQSRQINDSKMSFVEIVADRIQILTPKKIIIDNEQQQSIEHYDDRNKSSNQS